MSSTASKLITLLYHTKPITSSLITPPLTSIPPSILSTTTFTSSELISSLGPHPQAAYSTMRAGCDGRIFQLQHHLQRLQESTKSLLGIPEFDTRRRIILGLIEVLSNTATTTPIPSPPTTNDSKITVVVQHNAIQILKEEMKPKSMNKLIHVIVGGTPRHDPTTKNLQYVHDRQSFVDPTKEETLLLDPTTNRILEGSQSNFFVVKQGIVETANDGILFGTVRAVVLEGCEALGIPVKLQPPILNEMTSWDEAFLASTSRLVMGIDIFGPDEKPHNFSKNRPITTQLQEWVSLAVQRKSTSPKEMLLASFI
jgi:branched-subunit amino acid aminotransferase/4-amino-4-deoxychorismate lyase